MSLVNVVYLIQQDSYIFSCIQSNLSKTDQLQREIQKLKQMLALKKAEEWNYMYIFILFRENSWISHFHIARFQSCKNILISTGVISLIEYFDGKSKVEIWIPMRYCLILQLENYFQFSIFEKKIIRTLSVNLISLFN